jgi:AraC-like DNA-binding protein
MPRIGQSGLGYLEVEMRRATGFPLHRHEEHQLLSVERGALEVRTATDRWAVPPRTGVWLAAGLDHELNAIDDARVSFVYLRPDAANGWTAPPTGVVAIRPMLREIVAVLSDAGGVSGTRRDHLEAVLRDELMHLQSEALLVPMPTDASARAIADVLLAAPSDDRSLQQLSKAAGASTRTVQRRFRAETGLSFQAWRRRARVQSAMACLADGSNVTTTAHECGFSSVSAFINAFRSEVGTSPAAWTRQLRAR